MTPEAKQRLEVLQRFTELGAGFQVATHDLEIRGAGELLGARQQSGAVAAVGFETYARILEEAVAELRGRADPATSAIPRSRSTCPAFLPDDYVPDTGQRLDFYRRLARRATRTRCARRSAELARTATARCPTRRACSARSWSDKTLVRALGALGYELGPTRMVLSLGADSPLDPARVMGLVQRQVRAAGS